MDAIGQMITTIIVFVLQFVAAYYVGKALITYGVNYYFDVIDYRAKEFAEVKERLRRAGIDADLRRINQQLDEMERQEKE